MLKLIAAAILFLCAISAVVLGCSCGDGTCSCGNSVCNTPKTQPSTMYYQLFYSTSSGQSIPVNPFPSESYYVSDYQFIDSNCEEGGDCNCQTSADGSQSCETNHYCSNPVTTCKQWETCTASGCGGTGDGCKCDTNYCKGWCMDNAPVYDGLSGCAPGTINTGTYSEAICEKYLNGKCEAASSGKKQIASLASTSTPLCFSGSYSQGIGCYIDQGRTCNDYANAECVSNGVMYSPTCRTSGGKDGWTIQIPNDVCPSGQSCCIPLENVFSSSFQNNPQKDQKYTIIPNEQKSASGQSCYCNYLAINDYYECSDTFIKDSHPCASNNCAPDFLGGKSFCCPSGSCSHLMDASTPILCKRGDSFEACTGSDFSAGAGITPSLQCFSNQKEISYNGFQLKCDNGQWKNSQSCGETLFNYKLQSDAKPPISDLLETTLKYGFKNTPIAFYVDKDKPTDIIAYVIPKAKPAGSGANEVQISVLDSKGKPAMGYSGEDPARGDGTKQLKLSNIIGSYRILFSGGSKDAGAAYNISVDCYTPDKSYCNQTNSTCSPGSFCVEDAPANIANRAAKKGQQVCQQYKNAEGITKQERSENCYYCCPEGYCAHMATGTKKNEINSEVEGGTALKAGDGGKIIVKDSKGNEVPAADIIPVLSGAGKSVCELDKDGVLKVPKDVAGDCIYKEAFLSAINSLELQKQSSAYTGLKEKALWVANSYVDRDCILNGDIASALSKIDGSQAYLQAVYKYIDNAGLRNIYSDYVCKFRIRISDSEGGFDFSIPVEVGSIKGGKATIVPLTYKQWTVKSKKEFNAYDSQGTRISSGVKWSSLSQSICKLASGTDYGTFEAVGKGDCIVAAEIDGQTATLVQSVIDPSEEKDISVFFSREVGQEESSAQCYPEGIQKINDCSWICKDGVWGKGGINSAPCEKDCDCNFNDESTYVCTPVVGDASKKICCEKAQCALETTCVDEGYRVMKAGVLQECSGGKWQGAGMAIKSDYSRSVLSKKNPEKKVLLGIAKNDINADKPVNVKVYHFFELADSKTAVRSIELVKIDYTISSEDGKTETKNPANSLYTVSEIVEATSKVASQTPTVPFTYSATISLPNPESLRDTDYLIYLGSSIVAEVVK